MLCENYGSSNIHRFIDRRHLTVQWKKIYENVHFPLPDQANIDEVLLNAKQLVVFGQYLQVPKALQSPRGGSVKMRGSVRKGDTNASLRQ